MEKPIKPGTPFDSFGPHAEPEDRKHQGARA